MLKKFPILYPFFDGKLFFEYQLEKLYNYKNPQVKPYKILSST